MKENFHTQLKRLMDEYVHLVYALSRKFPKEELYGSTSQLRRSTLSVILNYIEGFARVKSKVHKNFLEISYGSLQESKYLLDFCYKESFCTGEQFRKADELADRIGAMLWGILKKMQEP